MRRLFILLVWSSFAGVRAADLTLDVELRWNGAASSPGTACINAAGQSLRFTRVAALVSGVALHRADGSSVRLEGQYGLLDSARGTNAMNARGVRAGDYVGIEFLLGLPPEANHADVARWPAGHALNPLVNGLHWSWQAGYVFLALEGRWRASGVSAGDDERGFLYHLATDAHLMRVQFAANFRVEHATTVKLAFDLGRVLNKHRLLADDASESTHSGADDELAARLATAAERAWFWLEAVETRGTAATPRTEPSVRRVGTPLAFNVPAGFPQPTLPADNPLTAEGVALGRKLFHDERLSGNRTQSCASCHAPERAFSDARALSVGARGRPGTRNAMPLFNLAWSERYAWDGSQHRVRDQSLAAMRNPIEMDGDPERVVATLRGDADVRELFRSAFGSDEITAERIGLALEQFQLTLVAADSRFDRALRGEAVLSDEEKRGFELFMTEYDPARGRTGADCFHCHGGALFTDYGFKNNGLSRAAVDSGRERATGRSEDRAKFKTPSLRNVALSAPYMHDGRLATLEEVITHYSSGVERSPTLDANLAKHPVSGIALSPADQRALVAFLRTLTGATSLGKAESL